MRFFFWRSFSPRLAASLAFLALISVIACTSSNESSSGPSSGSNGTAAASNCPSRCAAVTSKCHAGSAECGQICTRLTESQLTCLEGAGCSNDALSQCVASNPSSSASSSSSSDPPDSSKPEKLCGKANAACSTDADCAQITMGCNDSTTAHPAPDSAYCGSDKKCKDWADTCKQTCEAFGSTCAGVIYFPCS